MSRYDWKCLAKSCLITGSIAVLIYMFLALVIR